MWNSEIIETTNAEMEKPPIQAASFSAQIFFNFPIQAVWSNTIIRKNLLRSNRGIFLKLLFEEDPHKEK